MMNVIVMGKGDLACKIANWFHNSDIYNLIYVIPNNPPSNWTSNLYDWAKEKSVGIIDSGSYKDIPQLIDESWMVDLVVSVTYDKIIKKWFIDKCKKIINVHNGPLPQYRGVNPVNWSLRNMESKHGVTIHEISPGIDDGPIISQIHFPINPKVDEVIDVYERCIHFGWKLFKETIPLLWELNSNSQDESLANYYSKNDFDNLGDRKYFTRRESIA